MSLTVYRKSHFNAAHRLFRSDWSDEKNNNVFGKCNDPNFHGHNYELEVGVTGEVSKETGFLIDIQELKTIIKEEIEATEEEVRLVTPAQQIAIAAGGDLTLDVLAREYAKQVLALDPANCDAERLIAAPDCGLTMLGRDTARAKLANLAAAAKTVG